MTIRLGDRGRLALLALGLAILMAAIIVGAVILTPSGYADKIQGKWIRFALGTAVFILYGTKGYQRLFKSIRYWCIFFGFLLLHIFGVGHLFAVYTGLSTLTFALVVGAECACMALAIYWVLGIGPNARTGKSRSPWVPTL